MPVPTIEKIHIKRAMNGAGGVNILPDYVIDYTISPVVVPQSIPFAIGELIQFEFDISFSVDINAGDIDFASDNTYMYFSFDLSQTDTWLTDNANPANNVIAARFLINRNNLFEIPITPGTCLEINGIPGDDGVISDFSGVGGVNDNIWNNIDVRRMPSPLWRLCFTGYDETNEGFLKTYKFKVTHIYLVGAYKGLIHENVFNSNNNYYLLKSHDSDIERVDSYGTPSVDLPIDESYKQIINAASSLYKGQNKVYMFFGYGLKQADLSNNPDIVVDNFQWILNEGSVNKVNVIGKFYNIENWSNPPTTPLELNNGNLGDLDSSPTISLFANNQPISYISTDYSTDVELTIKDSTARQVVVYLIRLTTNNTDDFVINDNNYELIRSLVVLKSVATNATMNTVGWNWDPLATNKIIVGVGLHTWSPALDVFKYKFRIDSPNNCGIGEKYKIVYTFYPLNYNDTNGFFDMPLGSYISETFDVDEIKCYPVFGEQLTRDVTCLTTGRNIIDITEDCEFDKPIDNNEYETIITVAPIGFTILPAETLASTLTLDNLIPGNYTVVIREIANPSNIIDTRDFSIDDLTITITVDQLSATCEDIAEGNAIFIVTAPDTADLEMTLALNSVILLDYTGSITPGELSFENLLPGDYTLTITDNNTSCTYTKLFTIELFQITISSTNTTCKCDGMVNLKFEHPVNRPLQIIWTIDNTNQTLVYNVPNSGTLGIAAELTGLCVGASGTVKVKILGTECEQEGSFSISGSFQTLMPVGDFPHITPSCGCSTCKLFRKPIEVIINNYIFYIKEHQNKLFDQSYGAGLFGDMDCTTEKLNLINDYMYLGVYLCIIYNRIQNDIKKSTKSEPFSASVYYNAYNLDCVSKYFYCQGVDINKMFDIFGLGFSDTTTTYLTNKRTKQ